MELVGLFDEMKENSSRKSIGLKETKVVDFESKQYKITIDGHWDRSDWLDYEVEGVGFDFKINGDICMY
jgi:hypothetical protein